MSGGEVVTKGGHIPERTCVACRRKAPQESLVRLRRGKQGQWSLNVQQGRSVYLCTQPDCWKEKRLRRTFGAQAERVSQMLIALNVPHFPLIPLQPQE